MNFLVTGGAGFIGSHVCERLLRDGHRVWAFDDLNHFYDPQFKQRNLREIQALAPWNSSSQNVTTDNPAYSTGEPNRLNLSTATSRIAPRSTGFFPPSNSTRSSISRRARACGPASPTRRFTSA